MFAATRTGTDLVIITTGGIAVISGYPAGLGLR